MSRSSRDPRATQAKAAKLQSLSGPALHVFPTQTLFAEPETIVHLPGASDKYKE